MWLPHEENKTLCFPDHGQVESHRLWHFPRVAHLYNLISCSNKPTVLPQHEIIPALCWVPFVLSTANAFKLVYKFCVDMFSFLFSICLGVKLLGHMVTQLEQLPNCPKWLQHFEFSPATHEDSNFSVFLPTLVIICTRSLVHRICALTGGGRSSAYPWGMSTDGLGLLPTA